MVFYYNAPITFENIHYFYHYYYYYYYKNYESSLIPCLNLELRGFLREETFCA